MYFNAIKKQSPNVYNTKGAVFMNDKRSKRNIGLALIIFSVIQVLLNMKYYFLLADVNCFGELLREAAVCIFIIAAGVMLMKDAGWKSILRLMCAAYALTAVSFICDIPSLTVSMNELAEKPDDMLPGLNALGSIALNFEIIARYFYSVLCIILIACGLFVSFGKKGKTPAVILIVLVLFSKLSAMGSYRGSPINALLMMTALVIPEVLTILAIVKAAPQKKCPEKEDLPEHSA